MDQIQPLLASLICFRQNIHSAHWLYQGNNFIDIHMFLNDYYNKVLNHIDRLSEYLITQQQLPILSIREALQLTRIHNEILSQYSPKKILNTILVDTICILKIIKSIQVKSNVLMTIMADFEEYYSKQHWFLLSVLKTENRPIIPIIDIE